MSNDKINEHFKKVQKKAQIKKKQNVLNSYLTGGKGVIPSLHKIPGVQTMPSIPGKDPVMQHMPAPADYKPNLPPGLVGKQGPVITNPEDWLNVKEIARKHGKKK